MRQARPRCPASNDFHRATGVGPALDKVRLMQVRTWSPGTGWIDPNVPVDTSGGAAAAPGVVPGIEVTIERENGRTFRRVLLVAHELGLNVSVRRGTSNAAPLCCLRSSWPRCRR